MLWVFTEVGSWWVRWPPGTGGFPLPRQTGSWAESMTRVSGHCCFAPLCHISWVWSALHDVVLSTTLLLSDLLSAALFPICFPQMVMLPQGCRVLWLFLEGSVRPPCPLTGAQQNLSTSP